jgi:hypothetical protein
MRLFIAREAVDMHLGIAGDLVNPKAPMGAKLAALVRAGLHYAWWYPTRFLGWSLWPKYSSFGPLAGHVRYVERTSRRLARATFHSMVRFGPGLEKRQAVLGRIVDIGAELLLMSAVVSRTRMLVEEGKDTSGVEALADAFCRMARRRIAGHFRSLWRNDDVMTYGIAKRFLDGEFRWLESGGVSLATYRDQVEAAWAAERGESAPAADPEPVTAS